jgi:hypothetical protein
MYIALSYVVNACTIARAHTYIDTAPLHAQDGTTALSLAAQQGHDCVVAALVNRGAEIVPTDTVRMHRTTQSRFIALSMFGYDVVILCCFIVEVTVTSTDGT